MMKYARRVPTSRLLAISCLTLAISDIARAECAAGANRLESSEGRVSVERSTDGHATWQPLQPGDCVPESARIQVEGGRAVFRLANETLLRASGSTLLRIEPAQQKNWIQLYQGLLHFFTRTPHAFDVQTEYVNAGVKGTEFVVTADNKSRESTIAVLEGEVLARNAQGEQSATSDGIVIAKAGEGPRRLDIPPRRDAVQWTLYYPPLPTPNQPRYGAAVAALQHGNVIDATQALDQVSVETRDADYYLLRAAAELYRGDTEAARAALTNVQPGNSQALALQAMIDLTTGANDQAAKRIAQAAAQTPRDATVLIAQSYVAQAQFDLPAALNFAQAAAAQRDNDASIQARIAELALINDDSTLAQNAVRKALALQPEHPRALAIDGFVQLQRFHFDDAERAFEKAARGNANDPLPHLGLGLIAIRHNHVVAGREQLALAVALDPGQSLLRSYLGKAYQEEERDRLAQDQYTLAKNFDPADPTPWLYSALQAQTQNRPFDALDDLQRSIELNDNRAIYRSRLQLDADEAARTASQAEIYRSLGFDELAQRSAARAVSTAPSEYGGHRQLAESYADDPQYDAARASEVLQAQLLQPLSATPLLPILGETNLQAIEGAGPSALGYREYNTMFVREKPWLSVSGLGGGNHTGADEVTLSGIEGRVAYALNQYHYETLGHRDNDDARYDIVTAYAKVQATQDLSVLLSASRREEDRGNIEESLLSQSRLSSLNTERTIDSALLGAQLKLTPTVNLLSAVSYQEEDFQQVAGLSVFGFPLDSIVESDPRTVNAELQSQINNRFGYFVVGVDWAESDTDVTLRSETSSPFLQRLLGPAEISNNTDHYFSSYGYWTLTPFASLDLTAGISFAELNADTFIRSISGWYPKLSTVYRLNQSLALRAAYFQTLARPLSLEQTLEPTQLGGFNQFDDEAQGVESGRYMVGIDIDAGYGHQFGIEAGWQNSDVPFGLQNKLSAEAETTQARAFWTWGNKPWSISAKYQYEKSEFDNAGDASSAVPSPLTTHKAPVRIQWQSENGWAFGATATYVHQDANFYPNGTLGGTTSVDDRFTLLDLSARYQLLANHAEFELRLNNVLDESFRYQSTTLLDPTPRLPTYMPERVMLFGFKLAY